MCWNSEQKFEEYCFEFYLSTTKHVPNELENNFGNNISKGKIGNIKLILVEDFNIKVLDFDRNKMVQILWI